MSAKLFTDSERPFAEAMTRVALANPFLPERMTAEREALGDNAKDQTAFWVPEAAAAALDGSELLRPNLAALKERSWELSLTARKRLEKVRGTVTETDKTTYRNLGIYALFARYEDELFALCRSQEKRPSRVGFYPRFEADYQRIFAVDGINWEAGASTELTFALLFQLRRAFHFVFRYILGSSRVSGRLRADTWESIFTCNLSRYRRGLYRRMHDIPTLIVGPTGSGKELVAQALCFCQFIPFDEKTQRFSDAFQSQFNPLHLAALPLSLIESELFGHRRGAFTSAFEDRIGWLETCGPSGAVFLDEIGELPNEIQVKLLRVLQSRQFSRLGESEPRTFLGKVVAATHRDLGQEILAGSFREDLYHRLGADCLRTPSLRERIDSDPAELPYLVNQLSHRISGPEIADCVTEDCLSAIREQLGTDYPWPGNIRELEQCLRSVLVHGRYTPRSQQPATAPGLDQLLYDSGLTLRGLCERYATLTYERCKSYVETGRRLKADRRTIREHVNPPRK